MRNEDEPRQGAVRSVDRALTILDILARTGEAGVGEIAAELGVHLAPLNPDWIHHLGFAPANQRILACDIASE